MKRPPLAPLRQDPVPLGPADRCDGLMSGRRQPARPGRPTRGRAKSPRTGLTLKEISVNRRDRIARHDRCMIS